MKRLLPLSLVLSLFLCLFGCAGRTIEDPLLMAKMRDKAQNTLLPVWREDLYGIDASLKPSTILLSRDHHVRLHGILRKKDGKTRFAVLLPQGTKLGQCEVENDKIECSAITLSAKNLVKTACMALNEISELRPDENDSYSLHAGYRYVGIPEDKTVLNRSRKINGLTYSILYSEEGTLLAAVCRNGQSLKWRATFPPSGEEDSDLIYEFKNTVENWLLTVEIIKIITTEDQDN